MGSSIWVDIKNTAFQCYIGHYTHERLKKQKIILCLAIRIPYTHIKDDDLSQTIDYEKLYFILKDLIESKKYYLLENLAQCIISVVKREFPLSKEIKISLKKDAPPIKAFQGELSVTLHKCFSINSQ